MNLSALSPNASSYANLSPASASGHAPNETANEALAKDVAELMKNGQQGQAVALLNERLKGQPKAVQDAVYRMVSTEMGMSLSPQICGQDPSQHATPAEIGDAIRRINEAGSNPPEMPDTTGLTNEQKFDVYVSIFKAQGNQAALEALEKGDAVVLGLRSENNTLENGGKGVYDDHVVVLSRDAQGRVQVEEFNRASTEPTAQYDGKQQNNSTIDKHRDAKGIDKDGDGVPELGRLSPGSYEMQKADHNNPASAGSGFALRPTDEAVASGHNQVERDVNHDGKFDEADQSGVDDLNNSFKIHSGSYSNTDSAGCTTIRPNDYQRFEGAVRENPAQDRWQYVLVEVAKKP